MENWKGKQRICARSCNTAGKGFKAISFTWQDQRECMMYQQARLCWCKMQRMCADAMQDCTIWRWKYCGYPIYIPEPIKKTFFIEFSKLRKRARSCFSRKLRSRKPVFYILWIWQNWCTSFLITGMMRKRCWMFQMYLTSVFRMWPKNWKRFYPRFPLSIKAVPS